MRSKIVFKLFTLTTLLCVFILTTVFIGQTIFFKQYYAHQKVNDIQAAMDRYADDYLQNKEDKYVQKKLEQDFYQKHNTWITTLDQYGNLKVADDFYVEIQSERANDEAFADKTIRIPLYYLLDFEDALSDDLLLEPDVRIGIYGIKKGSIVIPYVIGHLGRFVPNSLGTIGALDPYELEQEQENVTYWENKQLKKAAGEYLSKRIGQNSSKHTQETDLLFPNESSSQSPAVLREESKVVQAKPVEPASSQQDIVQLIGTVTAVQLPNRSEGSNAIYTNTLFMDKVKDFQASLLLKPNPTMDQSIQVEDIEQNNIQYKILIKPLSIDGHRSYLIAMTSLQPVDEAVQMVKEYYIYLIVFVMLLVLLASFYYSKKIASPLLKINQTAKKMANLDFSESVTVKSRDELGTLSENINTLSDTLHKHIKQLQQDIEKEKQLENTRKEFISGVSHELKTPLSIMKSTISILQDDVAKHKRGYYFQALEKEVDKMDRLIADMLELAKYESGTYQMKVESFYIDEMIERVCAPLSIEAAKNQVTLRPVLQPFEVIANEHRIEQVITNFLTNAIRHTPAAGIVTISVKDKENQVKVCVENTGEPILMERLEKIWDRFYRGDTSRDRSKGETGLGLAISKNILELHGSKFGVENTETGVLFYFYLRKNK
ncbi:two-component sensor histidine kinase [Bacillus sp. J14TS2]|uniref:sensor histidine kinase n=1 Tax=Bacillus sp. J14TS2 TaxID=2807188 RepID=UPI001B17F39C|nr:HAMP domain-containing sensor histidine kinase [Bacillus sp. J14TS2]GIN72692.1 two-component sensor histidine kinase [Bacillus sp. J14TS2]